MDDTRVGPSPSDRLRRNRAHRDQARQQRRQSREPDCSRRSSPPGIRKSVDCPRSAPSTKRFIRSPTNRERIISRGTFSHSQGRKPKFHRPPANDHSWRDLARHVSMNNSGDARLTCTIPGKVYLGRETTPMGEKGFSKPAGQLAPNPRPRQRPCARRSAPRHMPPPIAKPPGLLARRLT